MSNILIGNLSIDKMYCGNQKVKKIYYGDIELYKSGYNVTINAPTGAPSGSYSWVKTSGTTPPLDNTESVYYRVNSDPTQNCFLDSSITYTGTTDVGGEIRIFGFNEDYTEASLEIKYPTSDVDITLKKINGYSLTGSITNGTINFLYGDPEIELDYIYPNSAFARKFVITPSAGYNPPDLADLTINNATLMSGSGLDYNNGVGYIRYATNNVTISAACYKNYTISTSVTNGTYSGGNTIKSTGTATITIVPSSGYALPASVSVSGATYSYNSTTGVISLSSATGNVSINAICEATVSSYNVTVINNYHYNGVSLLVYDADGESNYLGSVSTGSQDTFSISSGYITLKTDDWHNPIVNCSGYTGGISVKSDSGNIEVFNVTGNGTISCSPYSCYIEGTLITLSDGSYKNVEDITYNDELLVWNFDEGKFDSAKPLWLQKQKQALKYNHLVFSDGSELNTVNQHRIFNIEAGKFTYPMTDETPIGTHTLNDKGEVVSLIYKDEIEKEVNYYNIITNYHMNCFAGKILTSCRLNNLYPIKDLKFVKEERPIIEYNVPQAYYDGLRLAEQPAWEITSNNAYDLGDKSYEDYVDRLIYESK